MLREESFPIPVPYIDVTRATSTTLDVMLERRIGISKETETYQIRGQDSHDSPYWTKKLQMGIHGPGSGGRRNKQHPGLTSCGQRYGKTCQKQWAIEKPKIDNARRLRGIFFIDPADSEFKETIKKRAEKVGSSDASSNALQDQEKNVQGNLSQP